ncbi:MAG: GNAT family N-acetyltransferase [Parachlamydiales bacterium]|nr:GNAT family N-acetyltransferase [Parachlamydiales bacterium]
MVQIENFKIRFAENSDGKYLTKWLDDKEVLKWFPMCNKFEIDDAVKIWMSYAQFRAVITATVDNVPCGIANFYLQSFLKLKHQSLFAIIVDPKFRGKGVGSAILKELIKLAKERFKLEILHLEVYEGNPAYNLYERFGFKQYGVHKKFLKDLDGKYYDKYLMQKIL